VKTKFVRIDFRVKRQNPPGSILPTYLHTAFTLVVPKSVRVSQYLFTLLGSVYVKVVRRTLMKLSPVLF